MAQIEKTSKIDHYLDQIDKKDGSSQKRRVYLIIGILLLMAAGGFAFTQFSSKQQLATNDGTNLNSSPESNNVPVVAVNNANNALDEEDPLAMDDELLEEELPAEEAAEAEIANANNAAAEEANNAANPADAYEVVNENAILGGISEKKYSAEEVMNLPGLKPVNAAEEKRNTNASPSNQSDASTPEPKVAEEKKPAETPSEVEPAPSEKPAKKAVAEVEKPVVKPAVAQPTGITRNPVYPGGESKMRQFFARKISYPNTAIENGVEGNVSVRVKVDEKGKIVDSQIVKGIGGGCDREVLRAISKMPKWDPALKNGEPVSKYYMLSVAFKLPD